VNGSSRNPEKPARDRLAAMKWRIARHQNPVARYLTRASLITDLGHQSDEDGMHYAVDCAFEIRSQTAWPQAQLVVDEHGRVVGFEDDVYDGALFLKKQRHATERGDA
jgi:hypothetical protein